jgi:molecular chaperone Hsp33
LSELHKFIFDGLPVRGMLVRLTDSWQELLRRREQAGTAFAPPVRALLGELAAAATLMQANIKFDGALVLQVHGDGPIKLAVAEVKSDLAFRVTATVLGDVPPDASLEAMVNVHGKGRCAITLDPQDKLPGQQPYQGIVPLYGDRREPLHKVSEVLEHYMLQSEQLDTKLILAANDEVAAGLLIQRLPDPSQGRALPSTSSGRSEIQAQGDRDDEYKRIALLAATLTRDELLTLSADTVLHRLFWEEPLRRFEPLSGDSGPRFACSCSRERVGNMLKSLGVDEVHGIVVEQGRVEVACEFCGKQYHYDAVDVGELFTPPVKQPPGSSAIN